MNHPPPTNGTTPAVDEYGFSINRTPEQQAACARCDAYQARRQAKWQQYYDTRTLPPPPVLKRYCRKGIPPSMRSWVWPILCRATQRKGSYPVDYYRQLLDGSHAAHADAVHQIELDLPRTFPSLAWLRTTEGRARLGRILTALAIHVPHTGYCQGMNYVAALLLIAMNQEEEEAFWVMVALVDSNGVLYKDMYVADLVGTQVELRSLQDLLSRKNTKLHKHLAHLGADMSLLATDWFLCLYATALPCATVLRVWDSLLLEGPKVLYRVAIALLSMATPQLLRIDNAGELLQYMKQYTSGVHDRDQLMKDAFNKVGSMPMQRIVVFRKARQVEVNSEQAARKAARQAAEVKRVAAAAAATADQRDDNGDDTVETLQSNTNISNTYGDDDAKPLSTSVSTSVVLHGGDSRWGKSMDDVESTASRTDLSTVGQTVGSSLADYDATPDSGGKVVGFPVRPTTSGE